MKYRVLAITVLLFMLLNICSCKRKPEGDYNEVPLSETEGTQSQNQSDETEPQAEREHFPLEDIMHDGDKIIDPETDPKAKCLYELHGGGTVLYNIHSEHYSIINYDVSAADYTDTTYKPDVYSEGSRETVEHWESNNNLLNNVTFRGTPTGRTIQRVSYYVYDELTAELKGGATYVEFLLTEAYYGTVRPGDYVWVSDSFAVGYKEGKMQLIDDNYCSGYIFLGMDYLVAGEVRENGHYTVPLEFKALRLDVEYTPTTEKNEGVDYARYKKYILDKDIKLCKEQEYERFAILNYNKYYSETFMEHQGKPDFTYSDPQFAPTDEQKKIVDEQIQFYGERETRWKSE